MATSGVGSRLDSLVARVFDAPIPDPAGLPRYVAPLPMWLENVALRLAWPIAIINLVGTLFGFWYYAGRPLSLTLGGQFAMAPPAAYPLIPDSPVATLFIALSLIAWRLDWRPSITEPLHVLAFFGCIKLGLWTPYVQLALNGSDGIAAWLYWFLILSHMAMAVEAFIIHRYASFSVSAVLVATVWYGFNDVVDYFWPILEGPHHTVLRAEVIDGEITHAIPAHDLAAGWAVVLTLSAVFLALVTRVEKLKRRS